MAVKKNKISNETQLLIDLAVKGMQDKKAKNIVVIDMNKIQGSMFEAFVVCHGNSPAQVEAIADNVDMEIKKTTGQNPWRQEGYNNCEWIVLDYVTVVIHIFKEDIRQYYRLESLWGDAPQKQYQDIE